MVYLHGGAFYFGSGNTDMFGPGRLMTGEVILVTTNYRLGALGNNIHDYQSLNWTSVPTGYSNAGILFNEYT